VNAVLNGHVHSYESTKPLRGGTSSSEGTTTSAQQGTTFLNFGGGGAPLYGFNGQKAWITTRESVHGWALLTTTTTELRWTAYRADGSTIETITLPDDIVARVDGKSSLGRLGLLVHATAGYVDPGWTGKLTLELSNQSQMPIALYYGMKIGQISFFKMSSAVERPYGSPELRSRYQGQKEPTASAFHRDFDGDR